MTTPTAKRVVSDLAIFGGSPAFIEPLYVGRPNTGDTERFLGRVEDILRRRWLSNNGVYVQSLEERIAELLGVPACVAVCNGTLGLQLVIRALGLRGRILVPSFTFVATAHAPVWEGLWPVFADIHAGDHTLSVQSCRQLITDEVSAVVPLHTWGSPADISGIQDFAAEHRLRVIYDAAHAFGASYRNTMIGGFGDAEVFSFHATKFINCLEGGAICTHDTALAGELRLLRNFGFAGLDTVVSLGTNAKMNEISAAMGLTLLEQLDDLIEVNRRLHARYAELLSGVPGLRLLTSPDGERANFQYVVCEIDPTRAGLTRDQMVELLVAENVLARKYFYPGCHRLEPYRSDPRTAAAELPVTERVAAEVMVLPTGTALGDGDVTGVAELMLFCLENRRQIRRQRPPG